MTVGRGGNLPMTTSWGTQIRKNGLDTESKCWRCLEEPVPDDDDHIGLCDHCLAWLSEPLSELPLP